MKHGKLFGEKAMYISVIELRNIKCFDHFWLNLEENNEPILWTMILGDNSVGKTCLLRSIALGLCDQASSAALIKELPGDYLRQGEKNGFIKITLKHNVKGLKTPPITITTTIEKTESLREEIWQETSPMKDFPWDDIFVCGYGPHRALEADRSFNKYSSLEAVYTLFNYSSSLQNPEIVLLRQDQAFRHQLVRKILRILMLDHNKNYDIEFTKKGINIQGPWGKLPLENLSDGYKSTTNWLLDFIAWQIYADRIEVKSDISGIILVDEIEQHLHPKWQRSIIHLLKEQLPNVQFIATTHSPLIASSFGRLTADQVRDKVIHLERKNDKISKNELDILKGLDIDQVLASKAFDYLIDADPEVEKILAGASELAGKGLNRTNEEDVKYDEIKIALKLIFRPGKTLIEREIQKEDYQALKDKIKELEQKLFGEENIDLIREELRQKEFGAESD